MLENTEETIKNWQPRETDNPEKLTTQRNWQHRETDNPEKLAWQVTQDEETQTKHSKQYVLDTTIRKQIQIM